MTLTPRAFLSVVVAWAATTGSGLCNGIGKDLTPAQKAEVNAGKQVVILKDLEGQPWPQINVYQIIAAKPEEVAAVFFDYDRARHYIPDVLKSEVSKRRSACVLEVDYGLSIPILPDEYYTVCNELKSLPNGGYAFEWTLLRALQTKASRGEFRIEPHGSVSLVRYRNLTTPGSAMAGLLRGKAIEMVQKTVSAISKEVVSRKDSEGLNAQIASLRSSLTQE